MRGEILLTTACPAHAPVWRHQKHPTNFLTTVLIENYAPERKSRITRLTWWDCTYPSNMDEDRFEEGIHRLDRIEALLLQIEANSRESLSRQQASEHVLEQEVKVS